MVQRCFLDHPLGWSADVRSAFMECEVAAYTFPLISFYIEKRHICDVLKYNCIYKY
jgi:hypothetical protein